MTMMWVYRQTEPRLWTVGFYAPDGSWHTDSDHDVREDAARRSSFLNGGGVASAPHVHDLRASNGLVRCVECGYVPSDAELNESVSVPREIAEDAAAYLQTLMDIASEELDEEHGANIDRVKLALDRALRTEEVQA